MRASSWETGDCKQRKQSQQSDMVQMQGRIGFFELQSRRWRESSLLQWCLMWACCIKVEVCQFVSWQQRTEMHQCVQIQLLQVMEETDLRILCLVSALMTGNWNQLVQKMMPKMVVELFYDKLLRQRSSPLFKSFEGRGTWHVQCCGVGNH